MNILVTGGAGYIGTALVKTLSENSEINSILIYDNLTRDNRNLFLNSSNGFNNKVKFIQADILDTRKLRKSLQNIDIVYHLAARVSTPFSNIDAHFFEQTNHWGTAELVYAIEENNTVKKVIFVSSTSVYGASNELLEENSTPQPDTFYSISKFRAEQHLIRLGKNIKTTILRCGNVYGFNPSMRFDSVINKFMFDAHFNHKISIHGSGKQTRSYIHIERVSNLLAQLSQTEEASGIYHLTDKNLQVLDIVDALKELYPEMEFSFINQHIEMRNLKVSPNQSLSHLYTVKERSLLEDLQDIKSNFGFVPIP